MRTNTWRSLRLTNTYYGLASWGLRDPGPYRTQGGYPAGNRAIESSHLIAVAAACLT